MSQSRNNRDSRAVSAYQQQNFNIPTQERPHEDPLETRFPGHDDYQNGIITNGKESTFYVQATDKQIEDALNKNAHFSGFATDAKECEKAIDPNTGKLDANLLSERLQTAPWRADKHDPGTYRSNVAAFEVNWDALNDPKNADLKEKLCNPDGLSSGNDDIKVAYGQARANDHWGTGGGTQYYINGDTFNEAVNRGVLQYKEDKSFRECNSTLQRSDISLNEMKQMEADRKENIRDLFNSCPNKAASNDIEKAKALNEMTPEKVQKINSAVAPKGDYLAKPDPAYHYGQAENTAPKSSNISSDNISAVTGGGSHAPPTSLNNKYNYSDVNKNNLAQKNEDGVESFLASSKRDLQSVSENQGLDFNGKGFAKDAAKDNTSGNISAKSSVDKEAAFWGM